MVQLSHPYMTIGKTIALTRQICVGKVMSLLFNMLSRLVITFLPRSKRLLILYIIGLDSLVFFPFLSGLLHSAAIKLKDACSLEGKL